MRSDADQFRGRAAVRAGGLLVAVLGTAGVAGGCRTPRVAAPLTATLGGSDPDQQMEFWHTLVDRPLACNDEAFHALLLYLDKADPAADYPGRVRELRRRGLLPAGFDGRADEAVERGVLAVAIARALSVERGWATAAFGFTPRYATRELQYLTIYPPSSPGQTFTGEELVGVMGRVEDYRRGGPVGILRGDVPEPAAAAGPGAVGPGAVGPPNAPSGAGPATGPSAGVGGPPPAP